jgi:hypothetical protein
MLHHVPRRSSVLLPAMCCGRRRGTNSRRTQPDVKRQEAKSLRFPTGRNHGIVLDAFTRTRRG